MLSAVENGGVERCQHFNWTAKKDSKVPAVTTTLNHLNPSSQFNTTFE